MQGTHADRPETGAYVPAAQTAEMTVAPVVLTNEPAGAGKQDEEFDAGANRPRAHATHVAVLLDPIAALAVPATQATHVVCPSLIWYVPDGHANGPADKKGQYDPRGHITWPPKQ